jgi:glycosyltransferase involved in cell wall biosynthesis
MRVVYVSSLRSGGPVTHLLDLATQVARAGVDVSVVCATEELAAKFLQLELETHVRPLRHQLDLPGAAGVWPELRRADIVHTHDRRAGLLVRPQARMRGAHAVHTMHGVPDEIFELVGRDGPAGHRRELRNAAAWLRVLADAWLSRLGATVVPSHALARFLIAHGFPEGRLTVIPNGVVLQRADPGPPHDPIALGTAAILEQRKGIDVLLEACARVARPLSLEIFGEGSLRRELEAQAARLRVDARFHGFVSDVPARLMDIDLFVLPARAENLPIAILEAMALALPVVATRVGGIPELVVDNETGILVTPDDPQALAEAIRSLDADGERRVALGRAGAQRIAERFEAGAVARRMIRLYEELCA